MGLPDALKALKGQFTPEEAQGFALTSAMGLLPGAKAETAVAKGAEALAGKGTLTDLGKTLWNAAKANDFQPLARIGQQNTHAPQQIDDPIIQQLHNVLGQQDWKEAAPKTVTPEGYSLKQVPGAASDPQAFNDYYIHDPNGKKIGELTHNPEVIHDPSWKTPEHWHLAVDNMPDMADKVYSSPQEALKYGQLFHEQGLATPQGTPKGWGTTDVSDDAISKALAKNPGASIFDIAGTSVEGPSAKWPKKVSPIGEDNPQVEIKNLSPEEEAARQQRMQQDYPDRVYHGVSPGKTFEGPSVRNSDYLYMASNPELANLYAGVHGDQPYRGAPPMGQVVPLQADLSKFHTYDAKGTPASSGELWTQVNSDAIRQAKDVGAPGVTIKNVFDEPASTKYLKDPQTIHILLDKNWNKEKVDKFPLRSPFAMFDPSQYHANNLLAGLAGGAVAAPAITPQVQEYIKALQGGGQDQQ